MPPNPYRQSLEQAEHASLQKRAALNEREAWWDEYENYLEDYDIADASSIGEVLRAASFIYASLPANPHYREKLLIRAEDSYGADVPRDALKNMLKLAFSSGGRKRFTKKQAEALRFARRAKKLGKNPARFIAEQLGISRRAAERLLKRAETIEWANEMFATVTVSASSSRQVRVHVLPMDADVQKKRRAMRRRCIVCQTDTGDGRRPLCRDCHRKYMVEGDFSDLLDMTPEDLDRMVRFSNAQHRRDACYAVAVERYLADEA